METIAMAVYFVLMIPTPACIESQEKAAMMWDVQAASAKKMGLAMRTKRPIIPKTQFAVQGDEDTTEPYKPKASKAVKKCYKVYATKLPVEATQIDYSEPKPETKKVEKPAKDDKKSEKKADKKKDKKTKKKKK